jgi:uncharacterized protein
LNPDWPCLSSTGETSRLAVAVVPNAKRTGADGLHDGALRVRLTAPPVDGKANDALVEWLADALQLPRRAVRLVRGAGTRRKQLEIDLPEAELARRLAAMPR